MVCINKMCFGLLCESQTYTFRDIQQWKHLQQSCESQWKNTRKSVWTQIRKLQNDKSTNIVHNTSVFSPCLFNTHFQTAMNVTDGLCVYFISSSPKHRNEMSKSSIWSVEYQLCLVLLNVTIFHVIADPKRSPPDAQSFARAADFVCLFI